ncbi:MAG TPA: hypothetical protein VEI06_02785 [Gemmatimonadaceae bacterium]|nr:hypothetical protein [Gemmatimonadaceae bacterium]
MSVAPPTKLSSAQARDLALAFFRLATQLGEYRFEHWEDTPRAERDRLESMEWRLLSYSSDFSTQSIQLDVDDIQPALDSVRDGTVRLTRAVDRLRTPRDAIGIATTAASLAAAVLTANAAAIAAAVAAAIDTADKTGR